MFANKPLCKKDYLDTFCQKILVMTPQERKQFFYGEFQAMKSIQPKWFGIDYSRKIDTTVKYTPNPL